jgi:hypothetical protein
MHAAVLEKLLFSPTCLKAKGLNVTLACRLYAVFLIVPSLRFKLDALASVPPSKIIFKLLYVYIYFISIKS